MSSLRIDIRDARAEDADEVFAVHDLSPDGGPAWPVSALECREHTEWMLSLGNAPQVAVVDGLVVGEMQVWWGDDVAEFGRSLDVSTIYVHPEWQRRGVGSALIERAAAMAAEQGCSCVTVCYDESAEGFYRRVGFADGVDLTWFRLDIAAHDTSTAACWQPVILSGLGPPRGGYLRTERMQHPAQQWAVVRREEPEPGTISPFRVEVGGLDEPMLTVFRRATWAEQPWRAMPYVWAAQWDRRALGAVIACACDADIRALDIWVYGEMAEVLRSMGAEPRGHDSVLVRRLEQRTTNNEQRRS